jgi:hypothetical protein
LRIENQEDQEDVMHKKPSVLIAILILSILLSGCKSDNGENVVVRDCTDSLEEQQVENVLSKVLIPLQVDAASGSWEMWKYTPGTEKVLESDCQQPDCEVLKETCTAEVDLTNFETLKFEETDAVAIYDPENPDQLDDETKQLLLPSAEIDGNTVYITKKFINNSTCVDYEGPSAGGELKECKIWETEVKFDYAETEYASCEVWLKGDDSDIGAGENLEISSSSKMSADTIEDLLKKCESGDASEGQEIKCGFYGSVDFSVGTLPPITKETYLLDEYVSWLEDYSNFEIYINTQGDPQRVDTE